MTMNMSITSGSTLVDCFAKEQYPHTDAIPYTQEVALQNLGFQQSQLMLAEYFHWFNKTHTDCVKFSLKCGATVATTASP